MKFLLFKADGFLSDFLDDWDSGASSDENDVVDTYFLLLKYSFCVLHHKLEFLHDRLDFFIKF